MKTMVAAMFVALKTRSFNSNPLRVLHLGLGAGTLIRLLAHEVSTCQQVAVEIDIGVIAAVQLLPQLLNLHILTADVLTYQ
jgi:spermidine synthase